MTVCIAAICDLNGGPLILCASDRQITSGDIQAESSLPKVFVLSRNTMALTAGDIAAQREICNETSYRLVGTQPVTDVVQAYCEQLSSYRIRQVERTILSRFDLDMRSFLDQQRDMADSFLDELTHKINRVETGVETIICGMDARGPHIFVVQDSGRATCEDAAGFAAIGLGEWHVQSQFMVTGYLPGAPLHEAFLLIYSAKKRAETAPGVGEHTDMFVILADGTYRPIESNLMNGVGEMYETLQTKYHLADQEALAEMEFRVREAVSGTAGASPSKTDGDAAGEPKSAKKKRRKKDR